MSKYKKKKSYYIWMVLIAVFALSYLIVIDYFFPINEESMSVGMIMSLAVFAIIYTFIRIRISNKRARNFDLRESSIYIYAQPVYRLSKQEIPYKNIKGIDVNLPTLGDAADVAHVVIRTDVLTRAKHSGLTGAERRNRELSKALPYFGEARIFGLSIEQANMLKEELQNKMQEHFDERAEREPFNWRRARRTNRAFVVLGILFVILMAYYRLTLP